METLTIEINNPNIIQAIAAAASQHGVTAKSYALELLEAALLSQKSFEEIVEPQHVRTLSDCDRDVFLALLDSDAGPNEALRKAAADYKRYLNQP